MGTKRIPAWAVAGLLGAFLPAAPADELPPGRFPARVTSIEGKAIDVGKLAARRRVVVVTLKATWCPICQNQLRRIRDRLADAEGCGVVFLVLSPGPAGAIRTVQRETAFPYPFIEDKGLAIARSLRLKISDAEIQPAILILNEDLSVGWMQKGRAGAYYGDEALLKEIDCAGLI